MAYVENQRENLISRAQRYMRIIKNLLNVQSGGEEELQHKYKAIISWISDKRCLLAKLTEVEFGKDREFCELKIPSFEKKFLVPSVEVDRFKALEKIGEKPSGLDLFFAGLDDQWIVEQTMPLCPEVEGFMWYSQTEGFAALAYLETWYALNNLTSVKRLDFNPETREFTRREVDFFQATQQEQHEDMLVASSFLLKASDLLLDGVLSKAFMYQDEREKAVKQELEKNILKSRASKAANRRHERNYRYREMAITLYKQSKFQSQAEAARKIAPQIRAWAIENNEVPPLTQSNEVETVKKWIREHVKTKKAKEETLCLQEETLL